MVSLTHQQLVRMKRYDRAAFSPTIINGRTVPCDDIRCVSWAKCRACAREFNRR